MVGQEQAAHSHNSIDRALSKEGVDVGRDKGTRQQSRHNLLILNTQQDSFRKKCTASWGKKGSDALPRRVNESHGHYPEHRDAGTDTVECWR